jgi:hypothetical protein
LRHQQNRVKQSRRQRSKELQNQRQSSCQAWWFKRI